MAKQSETTALKTGTSASFGSITTGVYSELLHQRVVIARYDGERLATLRVFGVISGTVLENKTLWLDTCCNSALFLLVFIVVKILSVTRYGKNYHEVIGKESELRAFLVMLSGLIGLLLSFYTALNLSRWWDMRLGVLEIQEGAAKLGMYLSQGVTKDEEVLNAVHRYSRASLLLVFASCSHVTKKVNGDDDDAAVVADPLNVVFKHGLLTENEVQQLRNSSPAMPFIQAGTLWMWLANLVYKLNAQGLLKGPPHLCGLLGACNSGRGGVARMQTLLQTPIPMGYVHLVCVMVKLHNIILSVLYALICVMHAGGKPEGWDHLALFRTTFRAFFMPFMYNAILILSLDLADPFGNAAGGFDFSTIDTDIAETGFAGIKAVENVPDWMEEGKQFTP